MADLDLARICNDGVGYYAGQPHQSGPTQCSRLVSTPYRPPRQSRTAARSARSSQPSLHGLTDLPVTLVSTRSAPVASCRQSRRRARRSPRRDERHGRGEPAQGRHPHHRRCRRRTPRQVTQPEPSNTSAATANRSRALDEKLDRISRGQVDMTAENQRDSRPSSIHRRELPHGGRHLGRARTRVNARERAYRVADGGRSGFVLVDVDRIQRALWRWNRKLTDEDCDRSDRHGEVHCHPPPRRSCCGSPAIAPALGCAHRTDMTTTDTPTFASHR